MAGDEGIEPSLTVLETAVLPLDESPILICVPAGWVVDRQGLEPRTDRL